jgi:small nuclear ribonucleoprotein (snRNP)-like protein
MAAATPSSGSTNDAAASPSPALARLQATLNRLYRLTIADGRSFTGTLVCLDKELNLILSNTTEVNPAGDDRDVGMVRLPFVRGSYHADSAHSISRILAGHGPLAVGRRRPCRVGRPSELDRPLHRRRCRLEQRFRARDRLWRPGVAERRRGRSGALHLSLVGAGALVSLGPKITGWPILARRPDRRPRPVVNGRIAREQRICACLSTTSAARLMLAKASRCCSAHYPPCSGPLGVRSSSIGPPPAALLRRSRAGTTAGLGKATSSPRDVSAAE